MKALASMSKIIHRSIDVCGIGFFCRLSASKGPRSQPLFHSHFVAATVNLQECKTSWEFQSGGCSHVFTCPIGLCFIDYSHLNTAPKFLQYATHYLPKIGEIRGHHLQGVLLGKVEVHLPKRWNSLCCLTATAWASPGHVDALSCPAMVRKDWSKSKMVRRIKQWPWSHRWTQCFSNVSATNDALRFLKLQKHGHSTPLKSPHTQKYT